MGWTMSSPADLFVVCKQCGSEVSPYITECPYCGHRLRRRAPDLPRGGSAGAARRPRRLHLPRIFGRSTGARAGEGPELAPSHRTRRASSATSLRVDARPYATVALVALGCAGWILLRAGYVGIDKLTIVGPLDGDWWKLFSTQFAYLNGLCAFVTLLAVAIFGWLLERRHGPAIVLVVFFGAGATGALVASAVYALPLVSGGNGAALGLLAAWAVPDLIDAREGNYYEGDLLGVAAIAALLLALPYARPEVSWLAGVTGAVVGLLLGFGIYRLDGSEP
jgi:membrane associated rhomboid family serine protease